MYYTPEATNLILSAARQARLLGHGYVGSQHLLLALCAEGGWPGSLLGSHGLTAESARRMAAVLYGRGAPGLPLPQGLTPAARRILRGAGEEARYSRADGVRGLHILLSVLRREHTAAREMLSLSGVDSGRLFTQAAEHLQWETGACRNGKRRRSQRSCWNSSARI